MRRQTVTRASEMGVSRPAVEDMATSVASGGDVTAEHRPTFLQLYEDHFPFVWRSVRRLGTPDADVDDVVQESFVIAHRRLPDFEGRSTVKTWLFGIVVNVVRVHRRTL